jgi:hypothetical protein
LGILICTLTLKNSLEMQRKFKPSWGALIFMAAICIYTLNNMRKVSEFLYFQF